VGTLRNYFIKLNEEAVNVRDFAEGSLLKMLATYTAVPLLSGRALELRAKSAWPAAWMSTGLSGNDCQGFSPARSSSFPRPDFKWLSLCSPVGYAARASPALPNTKERASGNFGRCRCQLCEFSFRHPRTQGESGARNCLAEKTSGLTQMLVPKPRRASRNPTMDDVESGRLRKQQKQKNF